MFDLQVSFS